MKPVNLVLGQPVGRVFHFIVFDPGILKKGRDFQVGVMTGNVFQVGICNAAVVKRCVVAHFPIA
jgi:predicted methyltransferase